MNKVLGIELKKDKNGNDMKVVTFDGISKPVYVNSKYDEDSYREVALDKEFEVVQDGNFYKIKSDKPSGGSRIPGLTQAQILMQTKKQEIISNAQGAKADAIKLASVNGNAVGIVKALIESGAIGEDTSHVFIEHEIEYWRAYLWNKWDDINNELTQPF